MPQVNDRVVRYGRTIEEFNELVPLEESDWRPRWDHEPVAPFHVQAWHETNRIWPVTLATADFDHAMLAAVRTLGPGEGAAMVVLDAEFQVIFGFVSFSATLVELGAPVWYGCRAGYEWLEQLGLIDPMSLAVWEATAKDRAR